MSKNVKEEIAKIKNAAPAASEISPEEKEVMRKVESDLEEVEAGAMEEVELSREEQELLRSIKERYVKTEVYTSLSSAFKAAFRNLRQYAADVDEHFAVLQSMKGLTEVYNDEYMAKKQKAENTHFAERAKSTYENISAALKTIKVNLVASSEILKLDDPKFTTAVTLITGAGPKCSSVTLESIAEQFKGDLASLKALKAAAESSGASGASFDARLFDPILSLGKIQEKVNSVFGLPSLMHVPEEAMATPNADQLKFKAIVAGKELARVAELANVQLMPWDTEITRDDEKTAFVAGLHR